jgi:hypothetical protein
VISTVCVSKSESKLFDHPPGAIFRKPIIHFLALNNNSIQIKSSAKFLSCAMLTAFDKFGVLFYRDLNIGFQGAL